MPLLNIRGFKAGRADLFPHRVGHEGPAELRKVEALLAALDRAIAAIGPAKGRIGLKQTLAGALVSLVDGRIRIEPAPLCRRRAD